jgi:hypothetical protein
VHQTRSVQGSLPPFASELPVSQSVKLVVDIRQQLVEDRPLIGRRSSQDRSDLALPSVPRVVSVLQTAAGPVVAALVDVQELAPFLSGGA